MENLEDIDILMHTGSNFYIFIILLIIFSVLALILVFIITKFIISAKSNPKKKAYDKIKKLDLEDSKQASYRLTKYATYFEDNPYKDQLLIQIEQYKYHKEDIPFDEESLTIIRRFTNSCKI
ncbi:MAG: Unknown protein [uncultured Campylobacterales bacterium]|uniref:Uncharacterized protein n=1 Tax=uncultured Campylobacterales bacterium TaxID=352960 RepID=A0A6S6SRK2_9BACT|nr:MAG: Unknown protein [uncultured Campylobacterales bacterium]